MGPSTRKIRKTVENRKSQFSDILKKCSRIIFFNFWGYWTCLTIIHGQNAFLQTFSRSRFSPSTMLVMYNKSSTILTFVVNWMRLLRSDRRSRYITRVKSNTNWRGFVGSVSTNVKLLITDVMIFDGTKAKVSSTSRKQFNSKPHTVEL